MKEITRYFYTTIVVVELTFLFLWYINFNFLGILSWIGREQDFNWAKLFSPLLVYGAVKILYWFAEPLSELFMIILRWFVIFLVVYTFYYIFLI